MSTESTCLSCRQPHCISDRRVDGLLPVSSNAMSFEISDEAGLEVKIDGGSGDTYTSGSVADTSAGDADIGGGIGDGSTGGSAGLVILGTCAGSCTSSGSVTSRGSVSMVESE